MVVDVVGQEEDEVQPRVDSAEAVVGEMATQCGDEAGTPGGIGAGGAGVMCGEPSFSPPPVVAVEGRGDEGGEGTTVAAERGEAASACV